MNLHKISGELTWFLLTNSWILELVDGAVSGLDKLMTDYVVNGLKI